MVPVLIWLWLWRWLTARFLSPFAPGPGVLALAGFAGGASVGDALGKAARNPGRPAGRHAGLVEAELVVLQALDLVAQARGLLELQVRRGLAHAPLEVGDVGLEVRSEEHTSELQSLMRSSYAVFCLSKKTQTTRTTTPLTCRTTRYETSTSRV